MDPVLDPLRALPKLPPPPDLDAQTLELLNAERGPRVCVPVKLGLVESILYTVTVAAYTVFAVQNGFVLLLR